MAILGPKWPVFDLKWPFLDHFGDLVLLREPRSCILVAKRVPGFWNINVLPETVRVLPLVYRLWLRNQISLVA